MNIFIIFLIAILLFAMYLYLCYSLETFKGEQDVYNENEDNIINTNTAKKFKADIIDAEYHDSAAQIEKDSGYGIQLTPYVFTDPIKRRKITTNIPKYLQTPTYNKPGYYKYGYATYVPTYTDAILFN
jgi:hypothetical protein